MRRLKSAMAPTTASRLVGALVNRIASASSWSGMSMVVFMPQEYTPIGGSSTLEACTDNGPSRSTLSLPTSSPKCNAGHFRSEGVARAEEMAGGGIFLPQAPAIRAGHVTSPWDRSPEGRSGTVSVREAAPSGTPPPASGSPAPSSDARPSGPEPPSPVRR